MNAGLLFASAGSGGNQTVRRQSPFHVTIPGMDKPPSVQALRAKLASILETGSLYRRYEYDSADLHFVAEQAFNRPRFGLLPSEIKLYCNDERCQTETNWRVSDAEVYSSAAGVQGRIYTCLNCGDSQVYYAFRWLELKTHSVFAKVGQFPPLAIAPSKELAKSLGREDADLYAKGLINANYNHGIGAVAYLRRVIENKLNDLLELIWESVQLHHADPELGKRVEGVKSGRSFEDKIALASAMLPANLRPAGTEDPFKKLYAVSSAGLHGESDEECLEIFNSAKFIFEYLFRNLIVGNEEAREYARRLSNPVQAKRAE